MTDIWQLLKDYVREFEIQNNVKFSDAAWQRIKRLEVDIREAAREEYGDVGLADAKAEEQG